MSAMRKVLALLVAAVALTSCGTNISADDKAAADAFMDGKSQYDRDALCEQVSTAEGRLQAKKSVEAQLGGPTEEDLRIAGGPPGPEQQAAMDKVAKSLVEGKELGKRAETIIDYVKGNRC